MINFRKIKFIDNFYFQKLISTEGVNYDEFMKIGWSIKQIKNQLNKDVNFLNKFKHLSLTRYSKYVKGTLQTSFFNPVY